MARQHVLGIDDSAACDSANSAACGSVHVVKESALILMQTVPTHIQVAELKKKLIKNVRSFICGDVAVVMFCFAERRSFCHFVSAVLVKVFSQLNVYFQHHGAIAVCLQILLSGTC